MLIRRVREGPASGVHRKYSVSSHPARDFLFRRSIRVCVYIHRFSIEAHQQRENRLLCYNILGKCLLSLQRGIYYNIYGRGGLRYMRGSAAAADATRWQRTYNTRERRKRRKADKSHEYILHARKVIIVAVERASRDGERRFWLP